MKRTNIKTVANELANKRVAMSCAEDVIDTLISYAKWQLIKINPDGDEDRDGSNFREPTAEDDDKYSYYKYELYVAAINAVRDYIDKM